MCKEFVAGVRGWIRTEWNGFKTDLSKWRAEFFGLFGKEKGLTDQFCEKANIDDNYIPFRKKECHGFKEKAPETSEEKCYGRLPEHRRKVAAYRACFVEDGGRWRVGNHWLDEAFSEKYADVIAIEIAKSGTIKAEHISCYKGFFLFKVRHLGHIGHFILNSNVPARRMSVTKENFVTQLEKEFAKNIKILLEKENKELST